MNRKLTIVLAEDNRGDVMLIEEALECHALRYSLLVYRDGAEMMQAIDAINTGEAPCPDLILLDLNLPVHNGPTLLRRLRESTVCAHVPVIIVTSSDAPKDQTETSRLGANHYFRKPSDYDEFMCLGKVVKELVSSSQEPAVGKTVSGTERGRGN